jgi:threonine dehydratase
MFAQLLSARDTLKDHARLTPVMTCRTLNEIAGAEVFLKCENFQNIGAFKYRGAYNAMSRLPEAAKRRGVITYSSGNHGQAVALVGGQLGIQTVVVMPQDAPVIKQQATAGYGAKIIVYDPKTQDRKTIAEALQQKHGYSLIPPFDHMDVIAGQGTAAMELFDQVGALDLLLVPCGGGGLLSGSAIAARGVHPDCKVVGVEPEVANDATLSFHTGVLHKIHNPPTIADGTRTPSLGGLTFPLVREYVHDMITVSETAIISAVQFLFFRTKLVVEPSGALGVAALLGNRVGPGKIGVILSGGNIDGPTMAQILAQLPAAALPGRMQPWK